MGNRQPKEIKQRKMQGAVFGEEKTNAPTQDGDNWLRISIAEKDLGFMMEHKFDMNQNYARKGNPIWGIIEH